MRAIPTYTLLFYCIVFDGVVIAAQCTATFFKIYCAPPNLGITRTWICRLNFAQRPIFPGLRFFNEPEISDSGPPAQSPSGGLALRIFTSWKNPSTSAGFKLANLIFQGEQIIPRSPRPTTYTLYIYIYIYIYTTYTLYICRYSKNSNFRGSDRLQIYHLSLYSAIWDIPKSLNTGKSCYENWYWFYIPPRKYFGLCMGFSLYRLCELFWIIGVIPVKKFSNSYENQ